MHHSLQRLYIFFCPAMCAELKTPPNISDEVPIFNYRPLKNYQIIYSVNFYPLKVFKTDNFPYFFYSFRCAFPRFYSPMTGNLAQVR